MQLLLTLPGEFVNSCLLTFQKKVVALTKPAGSSSLSAAVRDLFRPRSELIAGNALLRQQLIVLECQVKRPPIKTARQVLVRSAGKSYQTQATGFAEDVSVFSFL